MSIKQPNLAGRSFKAGIIHHIWCFGFVLTPDNEFAGFPARKSGKVNIIYLSRTRRTSFIFCVQAVLFSSCFRPMRPVPLQPAPAAQHAARRPDFPRQKAGSPPAAPAHRPRTSQANIRASAPSPVLLSDMPRRMPTRLRRCCRQFHLTAAAVRLLQSAPRRPCKSRASSQCIAPAPDMPPSQAPFLLRLSYSCRSFSCLFFSSASLPFCFYHMPVRRVYAAAAAECTVLIPRFYKRIGKNGHRLLKKRI